MQGSSVKLRIPRVGGIALQGLWDLIAIVTAHPAVLAVVVLGVAARPWLPDPIQWLRHARRTGALEAQVRLNPANAVARRELFGSAVELATEALRALGLRGHTAHRMARRWRDHEERALEDMAAMWARDEARTNLFARLRQALEEAERIMRDEDPRVAAAQEPGWDNEAVRATRRPDEAEPPA